MIMKKNWLLTPRIAIRIALILLLAYLSIDYSNLPTAIGIDISRFNMDFLGIVLNATTAVVVFMLGYYFVEQWNLKRLANQKSVAESLLLSIYKECLSSVELLDDPLTAKRLFEQTDGNRRYNILDDLSPHMKFAKIPFMSEPSLLECFREGILDKNCFDTYQSIKHNFNSYVCVRVVFFDHPEKFDCIRETVLNSLHHQISLYENNSTTFQKEV